MAYTTAQMSACVGCAAAVSVRECHVVAACVAAAAAAVVKSPADGLLESQPVMTMCCSASWRSVMIIKSTAHLMSVVQF